jgi:hypothetical protein
MRDLPTVPKALVLLRWRLLATTECPFTFSGAHLLVPGAQSKRVGKVRRDIPKFSKKRCSQCVVVSSSKQEEARINDSACGPSDESRPIRFGLKRITYGSEDIRGGGN